MRIKLAYYNSERMTQRGHTSNHKACLSSISEFHAHGKALIYFRLQSVPLNTKEVFRVHTNHTKSDSIS